MNKLKLSLFIVLASVFLVADIYLVLILKASLPSNTVSATIIPAANDSRELFSARPLVRETHNQEILDEYISQLIKEYIVARYTITGTRYDESLCITGKAFNAANCPTLTVPAVDILRGNGEVTAAFASFQDGSDGEKAENEALRQADTTRSVRILTEPRRHKDRWVVLAEFLVKAPDNWDSDNIKRERWEIHLDADDIFGFRAAPAAKVLPSAIFMWQINWIKKYPVKMI